MWVIFFYYFRYFWSRIILQIHFCIIFFVNVSEIVLLWKLLSFLFILLFDDVSVCFFFLTDARSASTVSQIVVITFSFYLISCQNFVLSKFLNLFILTFFSFFFIDFFDYFRLLFLSVVFIFHYFINLFFHFFLCHVSQFNRFLPILNIRFKAKVLIRCHFILNLQKYMKLYQL